MTALRQVRHVAPEVEAPSLVVAEDQHEYASVTAALVRHPDFPGFGRHGANTHLLALRLDDDQRRAVAEGADIYVGQLTFGGPMTPMIVLIGKHSAAAAYNVRPVEAA